VCSFGKCECDGFTQYCGPTLGCVDMLFDPNHCGLVAGNDSCGVVCPPGETCNDGYCACNGQDCPYGATCDGVCMCNGVPCGG
jgi:hypothetical protein